MFQKDNIVDPPWPLKEDFGLWLTSGHLIHCPWRGGLRSLSDLGTLSRCPCVEVFCLCLTLALRYQCPWRGGLRSLSDLGTLSRCPYMEVFSLCLTLDIVHCPWLGGLRSLADLGRCPLPLLGGLCHVGLVGLMVDLDRQLQESCMIFHRSVTCVT